MPTIEPASKADQTERKGAERRAWVRYPCELDSACQPVVAAARGLQWTAKVRNLSQGGIALTLLRRFELGTLLVFEIQGAGGKTSVNLMGRVAHVTATSDGTWLLGCAFSTPLSEEDLKALL